MVKGTGPGLMPGARPATIEKASQSSRPQARMKFDPFSRGHARGNLWGPRANQHGETWGPRKS